VVVVGDVITTFNAERAESAEMIALRFLRVSALIVGILEDLATALTKRR